MWGFGDIQDSVMPLYYSWKMNIIVLTLCKINMHINSNERKTKTMWASQVAGDTMYKTEDKKSGHKYDKKSWSGQRKMEDYMLS
jgi:hypothetical protein